MLQKKHIQNQQGIIPSDYARSLENLSFPICCMGLEYLPTYGNKTYGMNECI